MYLLIVFVIFVANEFDMKKVSEMPSPVIKKAHHILSVKGGFVKYIGEYKGSSAYYSAIENCDTGFPFVYLYDGKVVIEITGLDALNIANSLIKDF